MSSDDWLNDESMQTKSKKKSKRASNVVDEPIDETFDALLDSAAQSANLAASKSTRPPLIEAASGWSNDNEGDDDDNEMTANIPRIQPPPIRQTSRRPAEEIIATDIPTISMNEVDNDEAIDLTPQIAVAPEFSIYQIASFKDIETEFSRERASQYIDSKIDIGILYHNLHLQEELDAEDHRPWDWDKLFVEIRNTIINPISDSY